ncbi:hypothetical protein [Methanococcoides methylutens]|nr:hypothetical protein [Methanococcoides methylutens]
MAFLVVSTVVVDDDNESIDSLHTVDAGNTTSSENENNSLENEVPPIPRNIAILMLLGMIVSTVLAYRYISRQ